MKNFLSLKLRKIITAKKGVAKTTLKFAIYMAVKCFPHKFRKRLMQFLDVFMPQKNYYCEKVSDCFYRGSEVGLSEIKLLAQKGIKKILDLKVQKNGVRAQISELCSNYGIEYLNIPMNVFEKPDENLPDLKQVIQNASAENPIYVHCKYGEDRTGYVTGLHRLLNENWPVSEIVDDMVQNGYKKDLFPHLADSLEELASSN